MLCYVPCPRSTCPEIRVRSPMCVSVSFFCFFKFCVQSTPWNSSWHFKARAPALWPPQRFEWFCQHFFFNFLFCVLVRKCDSICCFCGKSILKKKIDGKFYNNPLASAISWSYKDVLWANTVFKILHRTRKSVKIQRTSIFKEIL